MPVFEQVDQLVRQGLEQGAYPASFQAPQCRRGRGPPAGVRLQVNPIQSKRAAEIPQPLFDSFQLPSHLCSTPQSIPLRGGHPAVRSCNNLD